MNREQILSAIKSLAGSQGFYGRVYRALMDAKENDPVVYENTMEELESQNFKDSEDMVLYFEC